MEVKRALEYDSNEEFPSAYPAHLQARPAPLGPLPAGQPAARPARPARPAPFPARPRPAPNVSEAVTPVADESHNYHGSAQKSPSR